MGILRPNIGKLRDNADAPGLCEALGHRNPAIRRQAAEALIVVADARAVEPLIGALPDPELVVPAAVALGKTADARAVEPLIGVLADPGIDARDCAVMSLGEIGDARAVEPLIGALADPEGKVRKSAARALGELGDARAVEPLISALADPDGEVRQYAAHALDKLGRSTAESLAVALQSEFPEDRSLAVGRLGELGDDRAVELLIGALEDEDPRVQKNAAVTLGKRGDRRAVEPLVDVLTAHPGEESDLKAAAVEALGELGDPRAVTPLIAALNRRGPDSRLAFLALKEIGGSEAETALSKGTAKVGDRVRVLISGDLYAGMPGDRVEMGTGTVGEWKGTVVSLSGEVAGVRCDEVQGEVEGEAPQVGATREIPLSWFLPGTASELPGDPGHWCFEM